MSLCKIEDVQCGLHSVYSAAVAEMYQCLPTSMCKQSACAVCAQDEVGPNDDMNDHSNIAVYNQENHRTCQYLLEMQAADHVEISQNRLKGSEQRFQKNRWKRTLAK